MGYTTVCQATTPGLIAGDDPGLEFTVLAALTCGLPAGHLSPEHFDLEHGPWLHPDDPDPQPRSELSPFLED
jgi:hypothetical protein